MGLKLVVTKAKETFTGLGNTQRTATSRWAFPVDIYGMPWELSFAEIEGTMHGLISKPDLAELGYVWKAQAGTTSFSTLKL